MQPHTPELKALLATRRFFRADLYVIFLPDGTTLRYSGADCDIFAEGGVWPCGGAVGPYFGRTGNRPKIHQKLGTDVDNMVVDVLPGRATILGVPFLTAVQQGLFDGAWLEYRKAYMPTVADARYWPLRTTGTVRRFLGRIAEADAGGSVATFTVNSPMELLQKPLPRNLYQPGCQNVLGDLACGKDLAALTVAGIVLPGSTAMMLQADLAGADGWFDLGTVTMATGEMLGQSRTVRRWEDGTLSLVTPFPSIPATGDAIAVIPGCDGSLGPAGCPKFANLANYRGHPFVPPPSTAN
ncbi:DUF2163 domain-containing protein [Paramagnetospirillum magneticum]|uniref:Uncharacterized conserved protein n=1 Tax=Paramagnetospirillum magneticum (strain ATCC 700264 / AMB-1) TaxID=342108 RepID=Q2WA46_PARM1|nr:DUF2163 domain-containing protein [Paramagnetospirillum magneticum]BAE49279.1 Uncharacterized conserved protein [Paramagnetospirillum magneticum AMB-1]